MRKKQENFKYSLSNLSIIRIYDGDERRSRDVLSTKETPGFDFGIGNNKLVSIPVLVVSILSPYFPNIDTVVCSS